MRNWKIKNSVRSLRTNSIYSGLLFILLFSGALGVWILSRPFTPHVVKIVDNLAQAIGPLAIVVVYWAGAKRPRRAASVPFGDRLRRNAPLLILLGVGWYVVGQVVWIYYDNFRAGPPPFPAWYDAGYLNIYPCFFAGILLLPTRRLSAATRARTVLDSAMILTALFTLSWYFLIGPNLTNSASGFWARVVGAAYPIGDLICFYCLLALSIPSKEPGLRAAFHLMAFGLGLVVVADSVYSFQVLHDTYVTGTLLDVGWPFGLMLVGLGAIQARRALRDHASADDDDVNTDDALGGTATWRMFVPYLLLPAVGALVYFSLPRSRAVSGVSIGVLIGGALLLGLILLRQVVALLENVRLNRSLQTAFTNLEQTHEELRALHSQLEDQQAELEAQNEELGVANTILESLATTDGMTGLANHRAFQERLRGEFVAGRSFALLLLDVDHFKCYNDRHGHPAGDEVLCTVASLLRAAIREQDLAARYGGEEFAILLPETGADAALQVAERVRAAVAAHAFRHGAVTLSVGVSGSSASPEATVAATDAALYAAKHAGRNCVRLAAPGSLRLAA